MLTSRVTFRKYHLRRITTPIIRHEITVIQADELNRLRLGQIMYEGVGVNVGFDIANFNPKIENDYQFYPVWYLYLNGKKLYRTFVCRDFNYYAFRFQGVLFPINVRTIMEAKKALIKYINENYYE